MKTQEEKDQLKRLKQEHKKSETNWRNKIYGMPVKTEPAVKPNRITTGILDGETILGDDHPVWCSYLYVVDDNGGKVIRSDIEGNVARLKQDLRSLGYKAENIYSCEMGKRNLL